MRAEKLAGAKRAGQLLTFNRYTWHVMTGGYIHASCISLSPPPARPTPRRLFYSHVSCRICFHTTLVLQSRRHSRYIYLRSFRTGGPKDSGPGGEMSRHRARRRSSGRFNSQVRLAALATAADHPSVSAVLIPRPVYFSLSRHSVLPLKSASFRILSARRSLFSR